MGDGIQKKFALIVNGDSEVRHLGNVNRAVQALRKEGAYEISLLSTENPSTPVEHFEKADPKGLNRLIEGLKSKMDDDDLLVVYFTGHGDSGSQGEGCLALPSGCLSLGSVAADLKTLSYGKRILVMDNCYSGSGFNLFTDAKTTVASQGSPGEKVSCQLFSPHFWSNQVTDFDQDGKISVQERFQFAIEQGHSASLLQFYSPEPISFSGSVQARPFKTQGDKPVEVHDGKGLKAQLARLKPGQLALVDFSADWCGPCKSYQGFFEKLARQDAGGHLWIHAEGREGSEQDWNEYGIASYPTVALIDWNGKVSKVMDPKNPLASLAFAAVHKPEDQVKIFLAKLASADPKERFSATLGLRNLEAKAASAVTELDKALRDPDPDVRFGAASALSAIGPMSAPAIPGLLRLLEEKDYAIVLASARALGNIGAEARVAVPALLKLYNSNIDSLARDSVENSGLKAALNKHLVFDKSFELARAISAAAIHIDPKRPETLQAFLAVLRDPKYDYPHRYHAVAGISMMGETAITAVPTLISLFLDDQVGIPCRSAVVELAKSSPSTLGLLFAHAADKKIDPFHRYIFLLVLGDVGDPARADSATLLKIALDPAEDPRIRKQAALTLRKLDPARTAETAPILAELQSVAILFASRESSPAKAPMETKTSQPWTLTPHLDFSARDEAVGGGLGLRLSRRVWGSFELGLGLHFQGMHLAKSAHSEDFQLGASIEPIYRLSGSGEKSGLYLSLGEIGVYHLVSKGSSGAYLAPVGLGYAVKLGTAFHLDIGLKPQVHWEGEFKKGLAGQFGLSSEF